MTARASRARRRAIHPVSTTDVHPRRSVPRRFVATAATANQPAASTDLTISGGTQCYRVSATKRTD